MKIQQLFSVWSSLNFSSFLSTNGKTLEISKMWGNLSDWLLYICITRNFTCCSDCVKLSNSIVVQDMSLTVCDEEEVENMRHGEASSNMKMKETFPYFCASGILVHRSLPTFCYIADPRNILLLCVSSDQAFLSLLLSPFDRLSVADCSPVLVLQLW